MNILAGKVCIVTGSTAGIGKGIAESFLRQGAFVFVNGRSEVNVRKTLEEFQGKGLTSCSGVAADLSTADGSAHFFEEIEKTGREIDVLVNNMGIFSSKHFFETTDEDYLTFFNVNVLSTVRCCRKYLKGMLERNRGRIIIVSSECGLRPIADMLHYSSTKAAQLNIS